MNSVVRLIGENPLKFLQWPLWIVQLIGGLWVLSPTFMPNDAPSGNLAAAGSLPALKAYGLILLFIGFMGIYGLIRKSYKATRIAAFASFFLFFYFTLLRILLMPTSLGWTTFFLNGCLAAAIYLRAKWEDVPE